MANELDSNDEAHHERAQLFKGAEKRKGYPENRTTGQPLVPKGDKVDSRLPTWYVFVRGTRTGDTESGPGHLPGRLQGYDSLLAEGLASAGS